MERGQIKLKNVFLILDLYVCVLLPSCGTKINNWFPQRKMAKKEEEKEEKTALGLKAGIVPVGK